MHNLYIIWEEGYNLGIPIIDEQHRAIVATINTYHYFVTGGKGRGRIKANIHNAGAIQENTFHD